MEGFEDLRDFMAFTSRVAPDVERALSSGDPVAAKAAHRRLLSVATDWAANDADPLSDGDQSALQGSLPESPGRVVVEVWCRGWEINALLGNASTAVKLALVPPIALACAYGDATWVRTAIADKLGDEALTLVNSHYGFLRMTPLHYCAAGARHLGGPHFPAAAARVADHAAVADVLLAAGARLEARDVAGFTPLAQATTAFASRASLSVASRLIKAGADVQPVDRLGRTPLVQFGSIEKRPSLVADCGAPAAVLLLLEAGADASFTAETPEAPAAVLAAEKLQARRYLESLGRPVNAARLRALERTIELTHAHATKVPNNFLASISSVGVNNDYGRALLAVINDCQARGRVGAGRTLEGETVRLFGLKAAALNDLVVPACGAFDPVSGRYAVCVPGAGPSEEPREVAILAKNVEAVGRRAAAGTCCFACGAPEAAQTCGRCRRAHYCNTECQRAHWCESHKTDCAATIAARTEVIVRRPRCVGTRVTLRNAAGVRNVSVWDDASLARLVGTACPVKVSPVIDNTAGDISVYNESREFFTFVAADDPAHAIFLNKVKGAPLCGGTKAYFMAMFRRGDDGQVEVAIDSEPLPPQSWT